MNSTEIFRINELPDEIFTLILSAVRDADVKHFAATLRVCRRWYEFGEDLVWRHVVLTKKDLFKFTESVSKHQHGSPLCERLHSLTIYFGRYMLSKYKVTSDNFIAIDTLAQLLPAMKILSTFSFNHVLDPGNPWATAQSTDDNVLKLVKCLPASVQNLEINCPTIYFKQHTSETCLCDCISNRIEGLHSLRLVWPRICSRLFCRPSSTLQNFAINACKSDLRPGIRECYLADINGGMSWDELQEQASRTSKHTIHDTVSKLREPDAIRKLFPRIKKLLIIEPYHFIRRSSHQWFLLNVHSVVEESGDSQDGFHLRTESYPIWPTGFLCDDSFDLPQFILRRCLHSKNDSRNQDSKHDCSDLDLITPPYIIWRLLEGECSWKTIENGRRLPCWTPRTLDEATKLRVVQDKAQWEQFYSQHRAQHLALFTRRRRHYPGFDPDEGNFETWPGIQQFHRTYHVKAKAVGADYLWYLEGKLGHSALWGRVFEGDFTEYLSELREDQFTSVAQEIVEVQKDIPIDTLDYVSDDD